MRVIQIIALVSGFTLMTASQLSANGLGVALVLLVAITSDEFKESIK
jgi:hypothetical protein